MTPEEAMAQQLYRIGCAAAGLAHQWEDIRDPAQRAGWLAVASHVLGLLKDKAQSEGGDA